MTVSDAVVISNLSKTYNIGKAGKVYAVKNINLSIPSGCIFGFLGPNGAGKTTTIKMICGLVRPSGGKITIHQVDVWQNHSLAMRNIGAVLEGTRNIYWTLSAWDNLMYFGHLKGLWGKTLSTRAEALLKELELWNRRNDLVRIFSRGMQQKVAVACALIADPSVVLLDEPTLGLDVQAARTVKQQIVRLARDFGKTIILTTHQIDMAHDVCDRIAIIINGQIVVDQSKNELIEIFRKQYYQIKISGSISFQQSQAFHEMAIEEKDGVTLLSGTVISPQQLYSLIERLRALNIPLISVNQVEPKLEEIFIHFVESQDQYKEVEK